MSVHYIAPDVLLDVFSYVAPTMEETAELARIAQVSKKWNVLVEESSLWKWRSESMPLQIKELSPLSHKQLFICQIIEIANDIKKLYRMHLYFFKENIFKDSIENDSSLQIWLNFRKNLPDLLKKTCSKILSANQQECLLFIPFLVAMAQKMDKSALLSILDTLTAKKKMLSYDLNLLKEFVIACSLSMVLRSGIDLSDTFKSWDFFKLNFQAGNALKHQNITIGDWQKCGLNLNNLDNYHLALFLSLYKPSISIEQDKLKELIADFDKNDQDFFCIPLSADQLKQQRSEFIQSLDLERIQAQDAIQETLLEAARRLGDQELVVLIQNRIN